MSESAGGAFVRDDGTPVWVTYDRDGHVISATAGDGTIHYLTADEAERAEQALRNSAVR
jgi:YD repeat-containing protein